MMTGLSVMLMVVVVLDSGVVLMDIDLAGAVALDM